MSLQYDKALARFLWDEARDNSHSPQERGAILEVLVHYIMETQGQYRATRNVQTLDAEIDMVARNLNTSDPLIQGLGTYLLVEAKNWIQRVGASDVRNFISKIRSASCHTGILVSREGVTGVEENDNAIYTIRKYYHRDNVVVIVLDDDDIDDLVENHRDFNTLLVEKYEAIRFELQ